MKLLLVLLVAVAAANAEVYLKDSLTDGDWESRWIESEHKSDYGKWVWTAGKYYNDEEQDRGLQTSQDAKFYAISTKFDKFSNEDKTLVIQFSVKHEQQIDCGGGYIKLFPSTLNGKEMHGESQYNIMFGPDICGHSTKKVHVIFHYNGKNLLIKKDIRCKEDTDTHVYTLIVTPQNTYQVLIDNSNVQSGDLEADWDFLEAKEIEDPDQKKPSQEEWDEREKIPDPDATKPEDWDAPEHIVDPDATKPDDWDDEMDGEWEAPMIDNPEFKGEWDAPLIDNPDYKGKWVHPLIANPAYKPDDKLYLYEDIGVIGLDLWQVKSGTIFGDFLITDDIELAKDECKKIITERVPGEKKMREADEEEKRKASEADAGADADEEDEDEDDIDESEEELDEDEGEEVGEEGEEEEEDDAEAQQKDEL